MGHNWSGGRKGMDREQKEDGPGGPVSLVTIHDHDQGKRGSVTNELIEKPHVRGKKGWSTNSMTERRKRMDRHS